MEYVIVGLLVLIVILLVILLFRKQNNVELYDKLSRMEVNVVKEIGEFKHDFSTDMNKDFNELNDYMKIVKCIYAIGEVADRIVDYAKKMNINCIKCGTLENAMTKIKENVN